MKVVNRAMKYILAALAVVALFYKHQPPSVPPLPPHPSSKAISNVGDAPDYEPAAADAGKATEENTTSEQLDAVISPSDVVSLPAEPGAVNMDNAHVLAVSTLPESNLTPAPSAAEQMKASSDAYRGFVRTLSPELTAAAQYHADFMARYPCRLIGGTYNNAAFSHDTNGGSAYRVQKHGWHGSSQEILAMRPAGWRADCWELWRGSPGHWQAVMSNTTHCGFGVATNPDDGCTYYVGLYGTESPAVARSETGVGSSYPTPLRTLPTAVYSTCGPNGFRQVFVPQQPQQPRPRQYVQQPQQWQYGYQWAD